MLDWLEGILLQARLFPDTLNAYLSQDFLSKLADDMDDDKIGVRQNNIHGYRIANTRLAELPRAQDNKKLGQRSLHPTFIGRTFIHDVVVDININPDFLGLVNDVRSKDAGDTASEAKIHAEMTISIWTLNNVRYFTLAFSTASATTLGFSRTCSTADSRWSARSRQSSPTPATSSGQIDPQACPTCGLSYAQPTAITQPYTDVTSQQGPDGPLPFNQPLTDMEKLVLMQDRLIDAMEVPVIAMWKDESVATINKALSRLMYPDAGSAHGTDTFEILSNFKVYTEDFLRELTLDEYPFVVACRSHNPQMKYKIGLIDSNARRRLFEGTVDRIYDHNQEYQALLSVLKDVTWYTDQIKAQGEQSERQFQLICETLPQMVLVFQFLLKDRSILD